MEWKNVKVYIFSICSLVLLFKKKKKFHKSETIWLQKVKLVVARSVKYIINKSCNDSFYHLLE